MNPKIVDKTILQNQDAKWLKLKKLTYMDQQGETRFWEVCERTTRQSDCDAVVIFAILESKDKPPSTLLISQYRLFQYTRFNRPPVDGYCIEFPAGLIDPNETPIEAGLRELKEETGYTGQMESCSYILVGDPGMSNSSMKLLKVKVDLDLQVNMNPKHDCEEGEFIETFIVPIHVLMDKLNEFHEQGKIIDTKIWHFALGLEMAKGME